MLYKLAISSFIEMVKDINFDETYNYAIESPYQILIILFFGIICLPILPIDIVALPLELLSLIIWRIRR